jgi:transposase-like protein
MPKCPACKKEYDKAKKSWKYGSFKVQAFTCECGTDFREYTKDERHSFTLKKAKDGRWRKA